MAGTELLLQSLMKGAENIPDSVWEKIPGHRTPKKERQRRESEKYRESRRRGSRQDDSYRDESRYNEDRPRAKSISSVQGYNDYDPSNPPRRGSAARVGFVNGTAVRGAAATTYPRKPSYSPTEADATQQQLQQYSWPDKADEADPIDEGDSTRPRQLSDVPESMSYNDPSRRYQPYDPQDYVPRENYGGPRGSVRDNDYSSPPDQYKGRDGDGYRYGSYDEYHDERHGSHDRRRSRSRNHRSRSRSQSRFGDRFGDVKKKFDRSERGMTTGAIGAIAGGLVGSEVGKGVIPTIAGVVLGGLAANAWEARDSKQHGRGKDRNSERRTRSADGTRDRDRRQYSSRGDSQSGYHDNRGKYYNDQDEDEDDYRGHRSLSRRGDDGDSYDGSRRRRRASKRREEDRDW